MMTQPEKLDVRSQDVAEERRQELLRLALGEAVDVGRECYGMNWPGKAECFKTIQAPSLGKQGKVKR